MLNKTGDILGMWNKYCIFKSLKFDLVSANLYKGKCWLFGKLKKTLEHIHYAAVIQQIEAGVFYTEFVKTLSPWTFGSFLSDIWLPGRADVAGW